MKPGTIVKLPDGREGTVVYHGLDGYGIRWGRIDVDVDKILSMCPIFEDSAEAPEWEPEAMLREPYSSSALLCVGPDYETIEAVEEELEKEK